MLYSVKLDGISIMSPSEDLGLLSAKLDLELNSAGSFTFKMPPSHRYYNYPKVMLSIVEVYEGSNIIWFGRVNGIKTNWNNEKEVSCEGALAFLNDSIQEYYIWPTTGTTCSAKQFFTSLITRHNECTYLTSNDLKFQPVVADEFDAIDVTKEVDYCTTFSAIQDQCVGCYGGYIFVEREYLEDTPVNTIKWITEMENSSQPIQFGLNLLDLNSDISVSEIVTAVLPIGDDGNGNKIFITSKNPTGLKYIVDNTAAAKYGTVMQVVNFDDCHTDQDLYDTAVKWLQSKQLNFEGLVISLSVAELKYMDTDYDSFKLGQLVHVKSLPHKMAVTDDYEAPTIVLDEDLMISKVSYDLLGAAKTVTVGNIPHQSLTDMASSSSGSSSGSTSSGGGGGGGGGVTVTVSPYITTGDLIGTIYVNGTGFEFKYDKTDLETAIASKVDSTTYATDMAAVGEAINAKSAVSYSQTLSSGTTVGTINIDGTSTDIKAPTPTTVVANPSGSSSTDLTKLQVGSDIYNIPSGGGGGSTVSITPTLQSGTKVADYEIDQQQGTLYAPTPTTVVANPSGQATGQLSSVQIGSDIYEIVGGSGGAGSFTETTLYTNQTGEYSTTVTLSDSIDNYDLIAFYYGVYSEYTSSPYITDYRLVTVNDLNDAHTNGEKIILTGWSGRVVYIDAVGNHITTSDEYDNVLLMVKGVSLPKGGGAGYSESSLYTGTTVSSTITISDDFTNYDALQFTTGFEYNSYTYLVSTTISKTDLQAALTGGDFITMGYSANNYCFGVVDSTTQFVDCYADGYLYSIKGIKYGSGGSGGGVSYGYANPTDPASDGAVYILLDANDKKQGTFLYMTNQWTLIDGRPYVAETKLYDNGTEYVAWEVPSGSGSKNVNNISLSVGAGNYSHYAITTNTVDVTNFSTLNVQCRYRGQDYDLDLDISSYTGDMYISFTYLTDNSHNEVAVGLSATKDSATTLRIDSRNGSTAEAILYYMSLK